MHDATTSQWRSREWQSKQGRRKWHAEVVLRSSGVQCNNQSTIDQETAKVAREKQRVAEVMRRSSSIGPCNGISVLSYACETAYQ